MVAGDVVNTAARLQSAAPVDGILVGEATHAATASVVAYGEAGTIEAKGKAQPLRVWEATDVRSRLGVDVARAAGAPLVGREHELDVLLGALARARREPSTQLVTLVGVPGIGKSRLVTELLERVDADPELIVWRQGRSLPYGEGVSYWALGEMVKAQAGILETDSDSEAGEKLRSAVAALVESGDDVTWIERHLRPLVGLGRAVEGRDDRQEAFAAWRRFFEELAEAGPAVLVFEDLHWADEGLLDFVDHLVDWAGDVPLLVVCSARPELLSRRPGWGGGKPNAASVSLAPLADDETARLIGLLLERSVLPAGRPARAARPRRGEPALCGGVRPPRPRARPLRAREPAAAAVRPGDDRRPARRAVGRARRSCCRTGPWWGRSSGSAPWSGSGRSTGRRRSGCCTGSSGGSSSAASAGPRSPARREYVFLHALVRDVAYGQIPRGRRAEKHRLAAEWIASLATDRTRGSSRPARPPLPRGARVRTRGRSGRGSLRAAGPARLPLRRRPRPRAQRPRRRDRLLPGGGPALAGRRRRATEAAARVRAGAVAAGQGRGRRARGGAGRAARGRRRRGSGRGRDHPRRHRLARGRHRARARTGRGGAAAGRADRRPRA